MAIVITASFKEWLTCLVPLRDSNPHVCRWGLDGQAVSPSIILNVSASVVPSRTIAVTAGVSMCTM